MILVLIAIAIPIPTMVMPPVMTMILIVIRDSYNDDAMTVQKKNNANDNHHDNDIGKGTDK